MIEWIPFNKENPPELGKKFLVLDDEEKILNAVLVDDGDKWGLSWWEAYGCGWITIVTHYAVINLPGEEEA